MSFNIDLLVENQRSYIRNNLVYWEERYPGTVATMRKLFPVENVENSLDAFIREAFMFLNQHEVGKVHFGTMCGPFDEIEGVTAVSRPSKMRGSLASPTAVNDYVSNILGGINHTLAHLDKNYSLYNYHYHMWIPVYGVGRADGSCLMLHYGQKVVKG